MSIKFFSTILEMLLPLILTHIIDDIAPLGNLRLVMLWGGVMVLTSLLGLAGNVYANRISISVSKSFTEQLRHDLFSRITHLSGRQVDYFTPPSLASRLTTDTYYVHQMVDRTQRLGVRAPAQLLGGIILTFLLDPVLSLIIVATIPVLGILVFYVSKRGVTLFQKTQTALDAMVRKIQEFMTGVRIIKALSKTKYETDRFDELNRDVVKSEEQASTLMALTNPVLQLCLNIGLTLVIVFGAYRVNAGLMKPGVIVAFLSYFTTILNSILMVARLFTNFARGVASADRIEQVMEMPSDLAVEAAPRQETVYHVEFDHVDFSYNGKQNNLSDISFALRQGETLGIIGATGSGKTTVVNLLLRLYDVNAGEIRIDGAPIQSIEPEDLYAKFGVAFQNDFLYADTLRENIDFGRALSEEQIDAALSYAQADFVAEKEGGLDYQLAVKGGNLSGGQKQRVLIARALAAEPEILILDDSSSALDYKTDANLRLALHCHFSKTTSMIIAQRVSSIMQANHILVLEEGAVIGSGSHNELLQSCETYREMARIQMGEVGA